MGSVKSIDCSPLVLFPLVHKLAPMNAKHRATIARLQAGELVRDYREGGNSMTPLIRHQQPVTLAPVDPTQLERGDMVFVKVRGRIYTHKVVGLRRGQVQIGNNHGRVNGWTSLDKVYGIVTEVEGVAVSGVQHKVRRADLNPAEPEPPSSSGPGDRR